MTTSDEAAPAPDVAVSPPPAEEPATFRRSGPPFTTRLTLGLVTAAILPVATFGVVALILTDVHDETLARVLAARDRDLGRRRAAARRRAVRRTSAASCAPSPDPWTGSPPAGTRASSSPVTTT